MCRFQPANQKTFQGRHKHGMVWHDFTLATDTTMHWYFIMNFKGRTPVDCCGIESLRRRMPHFLGMGRGVTHWSVHSVTPGWPRSHSVCDFI